MQYLTVEETVRRLRKAGVTGGLRMVRQWIREQKVRDVWVLGRHTFIYEEEVDALIRGIK